jgi:hypothetical protein
MQKLTGFLVVAGSVLFFASCSDTPPAADMTQPTAITTTTMTSSQSEVSVSPSVVVAQRVVRPFCPSVPPFTAVLNLHVRGDGMVNLFVDRIRLNFVDTFGVRMPQVTLPAPVLTAQFGSALIEARDARTFAIPFAFGCVTQSAGTLTVVVDMRDDHGRMRSHHVSATVQ